jgi:hypothetical protein
MRKIIVFIAIFGLSGCTFNLFSSPPPVYVVFFPDHSTALTGDGKKIVDDVASTAKMSGTKMIEIAGPETKVAPGYDPSFAQARIHTVEATLVADGIDAKRLVHTSLTTGDLNVKADPSGAQRVELRLIDQPANGSPAT